VKFSVIVIFFVEYKDSKILLIITGEGGYFFTGLSIRWKGEVHEYVKTFDSVTDSRKFIGKRIDNVLIGKRKTSGGYIWIYEDKYKKMNEDELKHIVDNANTINKDNMGIGGRFYKGMKSRTKGFTGGISKKKKRSSSVFIKW
jgi:hypothetical protein